MVVEKAESSESTFFTFGVVHRVLFFEKLSNVSSELFSRHEIDRYFGAKRQPANLFDTPRELVGLDGRKPEHHRELIELSRNLGVVDLDRVRVFR